MPPQILFLLVIFYPFGSSKKMAFGYVLQSNSDVIYTDSSVLDVIAMEFQSLQDTLMSFMTATANAVDGINSVVLKSIGDQKDAVYKLLNEVKNSSTTLEKEIQGIRDETNDLQAILRAIGNTTTELQTYLEEMKNTKEGTTNNTAVPVDTNIDETKISQERVYNKTLQIYSNTDDLKKNLSDLQKQVADLDSRISEVLAEMKKDILVLKNRLKCPFDYVYSESQKLCLKLVQTPANWTIARRACQAREGDLAVISTREKKEFASALIIGFHSEYVFVGASDKDEEGQWAWVDGSRLDITQWADKEPSNYMEDEDCASLYNITALSDVPCHKTLIYLCEVKLAS